MSPLITSYPLCYKGINRTYLNKKDKFFTEQMTMVINRYYLNDSDVTYMQSCLAVAFSYGFVTFLTAEERRAATEEVRAKGGQIFGFPIIMRHARK